MDTSSECLGQETMAGHQMIPPPRPPQPTDHTPEAEPPAGPQSNSDQAAFATAGQEVTSAEPTSGADTADREVEEVHISTSGRQYEDEGNEQEGETEESGEEEEEEGFGNPTQDFPVTGQRSGRSSEQSSAPSVSKYNTVCYRKIKRGNTKQRIDEFEFMMNV